MALGTDTYITPEGVTDYLSAHYALGSEPLYWAALTQEQQSAFLADALRKLEAIPKRGRKLYPQQRLAFPRIHSGMRVTADSCGIPLCVAHAQAEEAVACMMLRLGAPLPAGRRLASAAAEELLREWISTAFKGVL